MSMTAINELIRIIGNAAPTIATALGSPVAGTITGLIARAFGAGTDAAMIAGAIQSHPDAATILTSLEQQHACWLAPILAAGKPSDIELTLRIAWPSSNR